MSIDYGFYVAFTTEIKNSLLNDETTLRELAELMADYRVPRFPGGENADLNTISEWEDLVGIFRVDAFGDQMSGNSGFLVLLDDQIGMNKYSGSNAHDLQPLLYSMTDEKRMLMAEIAELCGAEPPTWKLIRTVS